LGFPGWDPEKAFLDKKKYAVRSTTSEKAACLMWLKITEIQIMGENKGERFGIQSCWFFGIKKSRFVFGVAGC
jgi:hypothetical protein